MFQNTSKAKKLMVVMGIIAVLAVAGVAVFAFQGSSDADGRITVIAPNYGFQSTLTTARNNLNDRITVAQNLKNATGTVQGGPETHWASLPNHATFQAAIDAAKAVYDTTGGSFRRGDEFDVIVNIDGNNHGFASMMLSLVLPNELELVRVTPGVNFDHNVHASFDGGPDWNPDTNQYSPARTGTIVVGWGGRNEGNFMSTGNVNLLTYRVRVRSNAGTNITTNNITLAFSNAVAPGVAGEAPNRINPGGNSQLNMSIQGVEVTNTGTAVQLGTVRIIP